MKKTFIDKGVGLDYSSPLRFIQGVACLVLLAPYRLVDVVSTRIIYLKRSKILKVFQYSVFISGGVTVANSVAMLYFGRFSFTKGKFPVLAMLISTVALAVVYFILGTVDFAAYAQMDSLTLLGSREDGEEKDGGMGTELEDGGVDAIQTGEVEENQSVEENQLRESDGNEEVRDFMVSGWRGAKNGIVIGEQLSQKKRALLDEEMDRSEDPSEYLGDFVFEIYGHDRVVEDDINLGLLNISVIPTKFRALA